DNPNPPPKRTTHLAGITEFLRGLPLPLKLKKNSEIEKANFDRIKKKLHHQSDPTNFPDDGSSEASFVTVDSDEMQTLNNPSLFSSLRESIPYYMLRALELKDKRRLEDKGLMDLVDNDEIHAAKQCCMDGDTMADPNTVDFSFLFKIPDIYFDTADAHVSIPLSYFLLKNMQYVHDNFSTLFLRRVNVEGDKKGPLVLDMQKLTPLFGEELSLSYADFSQVGEQMVCLESLRDKVVNRSYSHGWFQHFTFFKQPGADEVYEYWKKGELELCHLHISQHVAYDHS
ncbi:hypothetical protein P691DRAFT_682112, partial [Macrolepiota fuliginosa MF-IS2]